MKPDEFLKMYRALQIFYNRFYDSMAQIIMPTIKFFGVCGTIISNYGAILCYRTHQGVFFVTVFCCNAYFGNTVMTYVSALSGSISFLSSGFKKFGQLGLKNKDTLFYKSCVPIKIKVAHFYTFEKFTVLTVFSIVVYGTGKLCIILAD